MMSIVLRSSLLLIFISIALGATVSDKETLVLVDDLATEQTHSIFFANLKGYPLSSASLAIPDLMSLPRTWV